LLTSNRNILNALVEELIKRRTLDGDEIDEIIADPLAAFRRGRAGPAKELAGMRTPCGPIFNGS
jgi:hypothetical protein